MNFTLADDVRALKPDPAPYLAVAERFAIPIEDVLAAHRWDVSGALAEGAHAAFAARPGTVLSSLGQQLDIVATDLADAVAQILDRMRAGSS